MACRFISPKYISRHGKPKPEHLHEMPENLPKHTQQEKAGSMAVKIELYTIGYVIMSINNYMVITGAKLLS